MRWWILPVWIVFAVAAGPTASTAAGKQADAPNGEKTVTTELELTVDTVKPIQRFRGTAKIAAADPRFVLVGRVTWIKRSDVLALGSAQAFAIHSPAQLGLAGWKTGDKICLLLTRTLSAQRTSWHLEATRPDAACRGGA